MTPVNAIASERYAPTGKVLGRGTWGEVSEAEDTYTGEKVAIKLLAPNETAREQMKQRDLDENKVLQKEAIGLSACARIVPRIFDIDKHQVPFLVMPVYNSTIADVIQDNGHRKYLGNGLSLETVIGYAKDIATGFSELHTNPKIKRAHCDLKPENLMLDEEGRLLINDLGSSTCVSVANQSGNRRDNIGHLYTRAYECFQEGSHPDMKSDTWAFGAFLYRLLSKDGKYPIEDELNNSRSPTEFMTSLDPKVADEIIKGKVKRNIPKKWKKFVRECLRYEPLKRPYNGRGLVKDLGKVIDSLDKWKQIRKYINRAGLIAIPAAILTFGAYKIQTHEPTKLTIPEPRKLQGFLYPLGEEPKDMIKFEYENIPYKEKRGIGLANGFGKIAKKGVDNRVVAYLLKTHAQANLMMGARRGYYTDYQFQTYNSYTSADQRKKDIIAWGTGNNPWPIWARSIEVALPQGKTREGKVDLEDVMAIARVGPTKVMEAKRVAQSEDFRNYITAKNHQGDYVIPKKQQTFLKEWLAYYHSDTD